MTWKPIPDYPEYLISCIGEVVRNGYIVKSFVRNDGYKYIVLCRNGVTKNKAIHRLVCESFHSGTYFPGAFALHRNHIKVDNREENLYWGTHQNNVQDNLRDGVLEKLPNTVLTRELVLDIRRLNRDKGMGEKTIARALGLKKSTVGNVLYKGQWAHVQLPD